MYVDTPFDTSERQSSKRTARVRTSPRTDGRLAAAAGDLLADWPSAVCPARLVGRRRCRVPGRQVTGDLTEGTWRQGIMLAVVGQIDNLGKPEAGSAGVGRHAMMHTFMYLVL